MSATSADSAGTALHPAALSVDDMEWVVGIVLINLIVGVIVSEMMR